MKLTIAEVEAMRRIYTQEGVGSREIDGRFDYVGSQAVLRNRSWHDPSYEPPPKVKPGPKAATIEILGEAKTVEEWAADPRCQVSPRAIRQRLSRGMRGAVLLKRRSAAGRPRKPTSP